MTYDPAYHAKLVGLAAHARLSWHHWFSRAEAAAWLQWTIATVVATPWTVPPSGAAAWRSSNAQVPRERGGADGPLPPPLDRAGQRRPAQHDRALDGARRC